MINLFICFVGGPLQGPSFFCSFLPWVTPMATHGLPLRGNFLQAQSPIRFIVNWNEE